MPVLLPKENVASVKAISITIIALPTNAEVSVINNDPGKNNGNTVVTINKITGNSEDKRLFANPGNFSSGITGG